MSASPRIDHRPQRAATILQAGDVHESQPGLWRVRDRSGSGVWHHVTLTSCDCRDYQRTGLACKHVLAKNEFVKQGKTGPVCPTCGSATRAARFYAGGCYRFFACCLRNPEHKATKL